MKQISFCPLTDSSALDDFQCGEPEIDRRAASCAEDQLKHRCRVFCAMQSGSQTAIGFYALGVQSTDSGRVSTALIPAASHRTYVPFIYLNYLGVRSEFQCKKVGTMLLLNALERCASVSKSVAFLGVALHALTNRAANLYERYGFRANDDTSAMPFMILPIQALYDLFGDH